MADLEHLKESIKEWLDWTDRELLRSILVFIDTKCWMQQGGSHSDEGTVERRLSEHSGTEGCSDNQNVRIIEVLTDSTDDIVNSGFSNIILFRYAL